MIYVTTVHPEHRVFCVMPHIYLSVTNSQLIYCSPFCEQVKKLSTMEKYSLIIVGIIWMIGNTYGVRHCPSNCDCSSEFWSTCEILYCDDDLDIPFLTIFGRLCPRHYDMWRKNPNLYKQLHNSYCLFLLNASEYRVYMHHFYIFFQQKKYFKNSFFLVIQNI